MNYKTKNNLETRKAEAIKMKAKYPDRIPIIVEKNMKSDIPDLDKKKYLIPKDLTVGGFLIVLRKRLILRPEQALFLFINNTIPPMTELISQIYEINQDEDGFLYCVISGETTFGF